MLALAVMSTASPSLAIATGFERRYGVLKRLGASPLPRSGLLAGKVGALLRRRGCSSSCVIGGVAAAAGLVAGADRRPALLGALACALLGTAAFASLGLFVAGALRAEATLAAANLVYLLLMAGGAVVFPATSYGGAGPCSRCCPPARSAPGCAPPSSTAASRWCPCWCWPPGPPSAPC